MLESLFKEVNEMEEGVWSEDDYEVFPKEELAEVKAGIKTLNGELKELERDIKNKEKQIKALKKAGEPYLLVEKEIVAFTPKVDELTVRIIEEEKRIACHAELDAELKTCKKIDEAEAEKLILSRWERVLYATVEEYLAQYSRTLRSSLENLWEKYHQPLHSILKERDEASEELTGYLKELGYE